MGVLRRALRVCLPSWAILQFDFIGSVIMENVTDDLLNDRVRSKLKMLGIAEVKKFYMTSLTLKRADKSERAKHHLKRNMQVAIHRLVGNVTKGMNRWANGWYKDQSNIAKKKLAEINASRTELGTTEPHRNEPKIRAHQTVEQDGWEVVSNKKKKTTETDRNNKIATIKNGKPKRQLVDKEFEPVHSQYERDQGDTNKPHSRRINMNDE